MDFIKNLSLSLLIFLSLQFGALQARMPFVEMMDQRNELTDELPAELSHDQLRLPVDYEAIYPSLAEGFDLLRAGRNNIPRFQNFMDQILNQVDGDANLRFEAYNNAIGQARNIITTGMKKKFLDGLLDAMREEGRNPEANNAVDQIQDPIFQYVMRNGVTQGFMHNAVKEWLNTNYREDAMRVTKYDLNQTLLYLASAWNTVGAARIMIGLGADVNLADNGLKDTPLHEASRSHHVAMMKLLLENGANINAYNKHFDTPLHKVIDSYNCKADDLASAQTMMNMGVNIEADSWLKHTPWSKVLDSYACENNFVAALRALLDAHPNVNFQNWLGYTPLDLAIDKNLVSGVQMLVDAGAGANFQDGGGNTALHHAMKYNEIKYRNNEIMFGPSIASARKESALVIPQMLVDAGADITIINNQGKTAEQFNVSPLVRTWLNDIYGRAQDSSCIVS